MLKGSTYCTADVVLWCGFFFGTVYRKDFQRPTEIKLRLFKLASIPYMNVTQFDQSNPISFVFLHAVLHELKTQRIFFFSVTMSMLVID